MYLLKNVSKNFGSGSNKEVALSCINLSFPSKGLVFVKGESGSGKSTLLNILGLLFEPSSGKLFFNGLDVSKLSPHEKEEIRLNQIGYVFQHFNLIEELGVLDNLLLFDNNRGKALEALGKVGLKDFSSKSVKNLSGGEKQRVGIARALMKKPLVLLCDEPTGALDETNSKNIESILQELAKDILVIVVSHEKYLFNGCQFYLKLKSGKIKESNIARKENLSTRKIKNVRFKGNLSIFRKLLRKKNKAKSIICLLSFCLMEIVFACSLGFKKGSEQISDSIIENSFDSVFITATKKEKVSNSESINIIKESKPSKTELSFLLDKVDIYSSLSFALPYSEPFFIGEEKMTPSSFSPYFPTDLLTFPKYDLTNFTLTKNMNVFVNDSFLSFYKDLKVGDSISVRRDLTFDYENGKDDANIKFDFTIAESVKEFSFLNSPRIYYPYDEVASALDNLILPNYSSLKGYDVSVLDFIINSSSSSTYSGRESLLHCKSLEEARNMFSLLKEYEEEDAPLSFSSRVYLSKESYSNLTSLICLCLKLFSIFELVLCITLLLLDCFYSYLRNKKYCAIFLCFGLSKTRIISLFSLNSLFVFLLSIVLFVPASLVSFKAIDILLAPKLGFDSIIINPLLNYNGIPFFIPGLFVLLAFAIYLLSFSLLYLLLRKVDIAKELKDE